MNECLINIIGFTETECDCFAGEFEGSYQESTSRLYMDAHAETKFLLPAVKKITDCGKKMGEHFDAARTLAIDKFMEKLLLSIGTRYTVLQDAYKGDIGQRGSTGALSLGTYFMGAVYEMKQIKGGLLRINALQIGLNQTLLNVPVQLWKAYKVNGEYELQELIATIEVDSTANSAHRNELSTPIDLPLLDDSQHIIHYLLLIDRQAGFQPLNMTVHCGCNKQNLLEKWMKQAGIQGNDIETLQYSDRKTGNRDYINGIVAEAELRCNDLNFLCENMDNNPFVKKAVEFSIWYQAGSELIDILMHSKDVNRELMTQREEMKRDMAILHNKFKSRIDWIAENLDLSSNTCYKCNTTNEVRGPYKTGIQF